MVIDLIRKYLEECGIGAEEVSRGTGIEVGHLRRGLEAQEELSQEDRDVLEARAAAVADRIGELDDKLNEASIGWKTSRMGKVDLAILRLALYEILYDDEIPRKVAVDEAVKAPEKSVGSLIDAALA